MNDAQYLDYCRNDLTEFARTLVVRSERLPETDPLRGLAQAFTSLAESSDNLYTLGPELVGRLFTTYPELAPGLPRHLLWFFGGDCLHFMPDDEIDQFQQLEEMRREEAAQGKTLNLRDARAKLLNLQ